MRALIVPPYPSFTYVMSQIGDSSHESQSGDGDTFAKPVPRPYSKYDDNPFMRTVRCSFDESVRNSMSMSTADTRQHPSLYPPQSKSPMSLPVVGKFLQKRASSLVQRSKRSNAV